MMCFSEFVLLRSGEGELGIDHPFDVGDSISFEVIVTMAFFSATW
jgi:hypothetical protein